MDFAIGGRGDLETGIANDGDRSVVLRLEGDVGSRHELQVGEEGLSEWRRCR
jgi:hypothetical protein